jgi:hypothetical protein
MGWPHIMELDLKKRGALPGQGSQHADWVHRLLPLPFKPQAMLSLLLLSLAQAPAPCLPSEILPASGTASPSFGEIMAVDGDRLMVAADSGGGSLDTIKVFERDAVGGGWLEVQEVALAHIQGDWLVDLDLDGDRAVAVVVTGSGHESWGLERDPASGLWGWGLEIGGSQIGVRRASVFADDVAVASGSEIRCYRRDLAGWQLFKTIPVSGPLREIDLSLRFLVTSTRLPVLGDLRDLRAYTRIPGPDLLPPILVSSSSRGPFGVDDDRIITRFGGGVRHFSANAAGDGWVAAQTILPPGGGYPLNPPLAEPLSLDAGSGVFVLNGTRTVTGQSVVFTYRRNQFGIYELDSILQPTTPPVPPFDGDSLGRSIAVGRNHVILGSVGTSGEGRLAARALSSNDCDQNGLGDSCDLILGQGFDVNQNNTLDGCEETGVRYCSPATANSSGEVARIGIFGPPTTALFSINFYAEGLPDGGLGAFMASRGNQVVTNPLYTGNFCLGGAPTYRNLGGRQFITETGRARVLLNRPFVPDGLGGLLPILPGETWYFQYWFYDPGATPSTGFSDALGVTFTLF